MADNFWTNAPTRDPKRGFRFRVQIPGISAGYLWFAKKADKPEITVKSTQHKYLGHTFNFPGSVEWNSVSITFVDPVEPDLAGTLGDLLSTIGYELPKDSNGFITISKSKAVGSLGDVIIEQIDEDGRTLEQWTLNNAFINKVGYGALDYNSEDLTELVVSFTYDWASYSSGAPGTKTPGPFFAGPNNS